MASLLSLLRFDSNFRSMYDRSFDVKNTGIIDIMSDDMSDAAYATQQNQMNQLFQYLKANQYKYGLSQVDNVQENILLSALNISNSNEVQSHYTSSDDKIGNSINLKKFNFNLLNSYRKNISTDIKMTDWKCYGNNVPVVLGSEFSKNLKVGDKLEANNKSYIIKGFFYKNILAFRLNGSVWNSFSLNNCIIEPFDDEEYIKEFNYKPICVYIDCTNKDKLNKLKKSIKSISKNLTLKPMEEDINHFIDGVATEKLLQISRVLIISVIATGALISIIAYKIISNKDRIGVLFSIGIKKTKIFAIFSLEKIVNIVIGLIGGSIFYLRNCEVAYIVFINENLFSNLYISMFILAIILAAILFVGFRQINKLSPKEMIGGFVE